MYEVTIVLGLLVAVAALVTLAHRIDVPYPILLVVGGLALGLALGFIPHAPTIQLQPELVFVLFLPPLLYQDALNISYRDFRATLSSIVLLAVGLVLVTTCVVAVVAHWATARTAIPLSWPLAFVLGAIVSPTDAVAASAIFQRLGAPRRLATVIEGESLVNDAMAIIIYGTALDIATHDGMVFSPGITVARFFLVAIASIAFGLAVGWAIARLRRTLHDSQVENTISLLSGFAAYLPAYAVGLSGVLSVVAAGIYLGRVGPRFVSSRTRLQAEELWDVVIFLLNGLIFILIGLQLPTILKSLSPGLIITFILVTAAVSLTVIVVRMAWMFPGARLANVLARPSRRLPPPPWRNIVVGGWAGMGGVVSLAAALALPDTYQTPTGQAVHLPGRGLIIFVSFGVILVTLVGKGLTLPWLIHRLGLSADDGAAREETKARFKAAQAALARLETLAAEDGAPQGKIDHLREHYQHRSHTLLAALDGHDEDGHDHVGETVAYRRLRRDVLTTERQTVVGLRDRGVIDDSVLHRIQRELDLEELQLSEEPSN